MEGKNGIESNASESGRETKLKDRHAPAPDNAIKTPKKRRKVNHGDLVPFPPPPSPLSPFQL